MRRSQKTKRTNFLKRGREWHRSCRPFPVTSRAVAVCFYPCAWCVCGNSITHCRKSKDMTPWTKYDKAGVIDEGCFEDPRWFLSMDSNANFPEHIDIRSLTSFQFFCVCVCACLCLCACGCVFVGCVPCTSIRAYKVLRWLCPTKLIWTYLNTFIPWTGMFTYLLSDLQAQIQIASSCSIDMLSTVDQVVPICVCLWTFSVRITHNHTLVEISRFSSTDCRTVFAIRNWLFPLKLGTCFCKWHAHLDT